MAFLFDDSCQQDGGQHYLFARWAWDHHELFVGVWARPLYTFVYAFPALLGYRAARLLTVMICLAIAHQTWRLAGDFRIERAPLAIALIWLQPSFLLFCADNMTEPIFALVYRHRASTASSRVDQDGNDRGFIFDSGQAQKDFSWVCCGGMGIGMLWCGSGTELAYRPAENSRGAYTRYVRFPPFHSASAPLALLATGAFAWWLAAFVITGDPLFIKHNWPDDWPLTGTIYGAAGLYAYPIRLPEIVGVFLLPPFFYGLFHLLKHRRLNTLTSSFLLLFILHTILRAFGLLGSAGYPRYLIAISPAIALITLTGWNEMAKLFAGVSRFFRTASASLDYSISALTNFLYADGAEWSRDARAIAPVHSWFQAQPDKPPISRLIWSHTYSCILFDSDPWENPGFTRDREIDLKTCANYHRAHWPCGMNWSVRTGLD